MDLDTRPHATNDDLLASALFSQGAAREEYFQQLIDKYRPSLHGALAKLGLKEHDREDVIQTTVLKVLAHPEKLKPELHPLPYLTTIARNTAIDMMRREKPGRTIRFSEVALADRSPFERTLEADTQSPLSKMVQDETALRVRSAVGELPDSSRSLIQDYYLSEAGDIRYQDLATKHQLPVGTVKSRIHKGKQALMPELSELNPEREQEPDRRTIPEFPKNRTRP